MLGEVDKYTWKDAGSSFGMSDLVAAYLVGQLEQRSAILRKRQRIYETYHQALDPLATGVGYPHAGHPAECEPAWHMFYVLLPDAETRGRVLQAMNEPASTRRSITCRYTTPTVEGDSAPVRPTAPSPRTSAGACCASRSTTRSARPIWSGSWTCSFRR